MNLKPRFLIKSGYYIVPSPSTALLICVPTLVEHSEAEPIESGLYSRAGYDGTSRILHILCLCFTDGNASFILDSRMLDLNILHMFILYSL